MTKKNLVVGVHSADFVWRAAGTITTITSQGGSASVIVLSCLRRISGDADIKYVEAHFRTLPWVVGSL
jgi:hypothetical protein